MRWLFTLKEAYRCQLSDYLDTRSLSQLKGEVREDIDFIDGGPWPQVRARITPQGELIILKGYSWDGNSPKVNVLDLFWLGTPDGIRNVKTDKPVTYYASLVHDVLGQFKNDPKMPSLFRSNPVDFWFAPGKLGRDTLYLKMLQADDFALSWIYFLAVSLLGPLSNVYVMLAKGVRFRRSGKVA
ncbi:MAG: hypothetical protein ACFCA4_05685 [Cyanophyceae cyanobacterium]